MAFTILVEGRTPKGEKASLEYTWKIGEDRPHPNGRPWYLEATDKELIFITTSFVNVPIYTKGSRCKWYGDMAKFIFNNLPLEGFY